MSMVIPSATPVVSFICRYLGEVWKPFELTPNRIVLQAPWVLSTDNDEEIDNQASQACRPSVA